MRVLVGRAAHLAIVVAVLAALSLPTAALAQQGAPTLNEAPGSGFPDRQYLLRLPSPRTLVSGDIVVTENGARSSGAVGVEVPGSDAAQRGLQPSTEYLITYRSVLPPNVPAEVLVEVTGMPAATDRYTTPGLVIEPRATFEQSWIDRLVTSPFLMVVLLGLLALWVLVRTQTRTPE